MDRYAHRHTLLPDDANLQSRHTERARTIRACFALAQLAHHGESREKMNPGIDYISHPITVYDILCKLGEDDPALLGSAFLHDVLELDHYRGDPERLHRELEVELEKEGISTRRSGKLADDIYRLVYEVTNPAVLPKNKELYQIDRVEGMSLPAKKLKIADQAASLVCNLISANDPELISYDKERTFKEKAEALCHSIIESVQHNPEERDALKPYDAFFCRTLDQANQLFLKPGALDRDIARQRMKVRHHFSFKHLFAGPVSSVLAKETPIAEKLYLYDPDVLPDELDSGRPLGLLRVDYDDSGRVTNFYMHISRDSAHGDAANALQQNFTAEIREKLRWASAYGETGKETVVDGMLLPGDLAANDNIRLYHLHPPMPFAAFAAAAFNAKVCSQSDAVIIRRTGERIKREQGSEQER